MTRKLKSLAAFNNDRGAAYRAANDPSARPNGIACPKCGAELEDTEPMIVLTSNPPQKNVGCLKCGYRGYRIA